MINYLSRSFRTEELQATAMKVQTLKEGSFHAQGNLG